MTQMRTLVMLAFLLAAVVVVGNLPHAANMASAGPPKDRQKWEYATLSYYSPKPGRLALSALVNGSNARWTAGKQSFEAGFEKDQPEPVLFSKLNKDLGGREGTAGLGMLLDRIGENGWELATHAITTGPTSTIQVWTFKRPAQ